MKTLREAADFAGDLPVRIRRRLKKEKVDYRAFLFEDLKRRLCGKVPRRVLEIGPKEGDDTRRLVTLGAEKLVLVDLPVMRDKINSWLPNLNNASIELAIGNFMYDAAFNEIEPFDVVWCTGVLYHNPEQLRLVRQLFDITRPGGILVLETATARRAATRDENCVEIWYPADKAKSQAVHLSINITHLPSVKAVESWLQMVGFADVERSDCHGKVLRRLAATRAAYIATRKGDDIGTYYSGEFPLARAR